MIGGNSSVKKRLNILILLVTHDINSIKELCKEIIILRNGEIIEKGLTQEELAHKSGTTKSYISRIEKKVIKRIILYNVEILEFQYSLLERLDKKREYRVIHQIERDIKIIEERLNIYREFDNISKL